MDTIVTTCMHKIYQTPACTHTLSHTHTHTYTHTHARTHRENRSVDDVVSLGLFCVLQHLDSPETYASNPFVDYTSAFNTSVPSKLLKQCKAMVTITLQAMYITIDMTISLFLYSVSEEEARDLFSFLKRVPVEVADRCGHASSQTVVV